LVAGFAGVAGLAPVAGLATVAGGAVFTTVVCGAVDVAATGAFAAVAGVLAGDEVTAGELLAM
jgi:hypothetical protein